MRSSPVQRETECYRASRLQHWRLSPPARLRDQIDTTLGCQAGGTREREREVTASGGGARQNLLGMFQHNRNREEEAVV